MSASVLITTTSLLRSNAVSRPSAGLGGAYPRGRRSTLKSR